jgi:hypothetical protein
LALDPNISLYFFGEHGAIIKQTLGSMAPDFQTLNLLLRNLNSDRLGLDSVVLFSPGGVSQDEFTSFETRGDFFRQWFESF